MKYVTEDCGQVASGSSSGISPAAILSAVVLYAWLM